MRFHLSPEDGLPRVCKAVKQCRFGAQTPHFESATAATEYAATQAGLQSLLSLRRDFSPPLPPEAPEALQEAAATTPGGVNLFVTEAEDGATVGVFQEKIDPSIYAFICPAFNEANGQWSPVKVGDTMRTVDQRTAEWRAKGKLYEDLEVIGTLPATFTTEEGKKVYVRDYNFHKFLLSNGYERLYDLPRDTIDFLGTTDISNEFFLEKGNWKRQLSFALVEEALEDQREKYGQPGSGYEYYDEVRGQKFLVSYPPTQSFALRGFQQAVVEDVVAYLKRGNPSAEYLLSAPTRSGKSFMAAEAALKLFNESPDKKERHLAVVVSGIAQVEDEWKQTFESHKDFNQSEKAFGQTDPTKNKCGAVPCSCKTKFAYLSRKNLDQDAEAVEKAYAAGAENVVVFLTLQDLAGSVGSRKNKHFKAHNFLKEAAPDLLIVDEAHFASFTEGGDYNSAIMGSPAGPATPKVEEKQLEAADEERMTEAETAEAVRRLEALSPSLGRLFVTATPFNVLAGTNRFERGVNASILTEAEIWAEKEAWDEEHEEGRRAGTVQAWENPCFGLVKRKSFAVDLGLPPNELFKPDVISHQKGRRPKFVNAAAAEAAVRGMFGQGTAAPHIFRQEDYQKAGLGNNVYISLPYCASCDAFEDVVRRVLREEGLEGEYEVLNISSTDGSAEYTKMDVVGIKDHIENSKKKTITITVDKMGTGVTVPKWDTVIVARSLNSAQKFVQTAGRAGTPWVSTQTSAGAKDKKLCRRCQQEAPRAAGKLLCQGCYEEEGEESAFADQTIKVVEKPNCAVIGFDPAQMLQVRYKEALYSSANRSHDLGSGEETEAALEEALEANEVYVYDPAKVSMVKVTATNVLEKVFEALQGRGTNEIASTIPMDVTKLTPDLAVELETLVGASPKGGFRQDFAAFQGAETPAGQCMAEDCAEPVREGGGKGGSALRLCEEHFLAAGAHLASLSQKKRKTPEVGEGPVFTPEQKAALAEAEALKQSLEGKVRAVYSATLLYALLSDEEERGVASILQAIEAAEAETPRGRAAVLAEHLGLPVGLLGSLRESGVADAMGFDTAVAMVNRNFARSTKTPWEKFSVALSSFGRFSPNEVPTPEGVSKLLLEKLAVTPAQWQRFGRSGTGLLDNGSKSAVNLAAFYEEGRRQGLTHEQLADKLFAVPTSPATFELNRKVFEAYGWRQENLLFAEGLSPLEMNQLLLLARETEKRCTAADPAYCPYHGRVAQTVGDAVLRGTPAARLRQARGALLDKMETPAEGEALMRRMATMKQRFDYCISNPPYQEVVAERPGINDLTRDIFDKFQQAGLAVAENTSMIYPAGRWWFQANSGLRDSLVESKRLKSVAFFTQGEADAKIFPGVGIADGLSIVTAGPRRQEKYFVTSNTSPAVELPFDGKVYPMDTRLIPLVKRLMPVLQAQGSLASRNELLTNEAKLTGSRLQQLALTPYTEAPYDEERFMKIYANASSSLGGKSAFYLLPRSEVPHYQPAHKVAFGQSIIENPNRAFRVLRFDADTTMANSAVVMARFASEEEAKNFEAYAKTRLFEAAFRSTIAGRKKQLAVFVPDLQDYTAENPLFKPHRELPEGHAYFGLTLEQRLYKYFNLSQEEIELLESEE